jgi:hypothetical protein
VVEHAQQEPAKKIKKKWQKDGGDPIKKRRKPRSTADNL